MADLYIGIVIMAIASAVAFAGSRAVTKRFGRSALLLILLGGTALFAAYLRLVVDKVWIAGLLPFSNVMIVGNFTPVIASALAGVATHAMTGIAVRKAVVLVPLVGLSCWIAWRPVFASPPIDGARLVYGIWRQTDQASCTPAATATMLNLLNIPATASEMADLCRTTKDGTSSMGLYRGLVLKTLGTPYRVRVLSDGSIDDLKLTRDKPVVLNVGLPLEGDFDPRYSRDWGWTPGVRHTVVFVRFIDDRLLFVADPATGRERWTIDTLKVLWHGEGFWLEEKDNVGSTSADATQTVR